MKKKILLGIVLLVSLIGTFLSTFFIFKKVDEPDSIMLERKLKEKYTEQYKSIDRSARELEKAILLGESRKDYFKLGYKQLAEKMNNKETFILYMGFDECPWCRELVPILNKIPAKKLYLNTREEQVSDEVRAEIEGYFREYLNTKDGNKVFLVPKVFFIKDGVINYAHETTVKGHNAYERKMNENEINQVKESLMKGYSRMMSKEHFVFQRDESFRDKEN